MTNAIATLTYDEDADDERGVGWQLRGRTADGERVASDHETKVDARRAAVALGITDLVMVG